MTKEEAYINQIVIYKPDHAETIQHPDCELGAITSIKETTCFVRYIRSSTLQATPEGTDYRNLTPLEHKNFLVYGFKRY